MTEKEARVAGRKLKIGSVPMFHVARAVERDETAFFFALLDSVKPAA